MKNNQVSQDMVMKNLEKCPHFNTCSRNLCPLDPELHLRVGGKQDRCRYMQVPRKKKIQGREFVSGGSVMPDTLLNFVPRDNLKLLNSASQKRWKQIKDLDLNLNYETAFGKRKNISR